MGLGAQRQVGALSIAVLAFSAEGAGDLTWVTQFGTTAYDGASALAPGAAGSLFVAGNSTGAIGGPHAGGYDSFLALYDETGKQAWLLQFGSTEWDLAYAAAAADAGGVFIAGYTSGALGGPSAGAEDAYLARYTADGIRNWIVQFGTGDSDVINCAAPDGAGGVFAAGRTGGSLGGLNAGSGDCFLARYDDDGNQRWIRQFGSVEFEEAMAVVPDDAGGVIVAGSTQGDLGGENAGNYDVVLARYDGTGEQKWIKQFGTKGVDNAWAAAADGDGGIYVAGYTSGSLGGANHGATDGWVARYDDAGERRWIRQFGSSSLDACYAAASDGAEGVVVAGNTAGNVGGPNLGLYDAFLCAYDRDGNPVWTAQVGTGREDFAAALAPAGDRRLFLAGETRGSFGGPHIGGNDAYVALYAPGCDADCDGNGELDLFDFLCFVNLFNEGADEADCIGDGTLDLFDFLCFVNAFNGGC